MRLVSFGDVGQERPGVVQGEWILDLGRLRPSWPGSWRDILQEGLFGGVAEVMREAGFALPDPAAGTATESHGGSHAGLAAEAAHPLGSVRLGPPIPNPSKIVAIGLNYRDHALEQKKEPPSAPLLFAKAPSCLIGPTDGIRLPDPSLEDRVDAEAELCVVLGRRAREVDEQEATRCILGYTIMNDVSGRAAQYGDKQWFRGKSFDTFAPCGPWIVTADELPDPSGLGLEADWGERPMQRGNTRDLIFPVPALISYVSRMMTLFPGDLITTGTPAGVGVFRDPPVFLQRGQTVTVRLEKVGEIRNPVE